MPDTTAKINTKGCENTGLTEEIAHSLHSQVGRHFMGIVELRVVQKHGPNADGKRSIDLIISQLEPAIDTDGDGTLEDHLRELTRTLHQNRALKPKDKGQLALEAGDDIAPKPADVIAAGQQHIAHEYLEGPGPGPDGTVVCDVCGGDEGDRIHVITDALEDDPDQDPEHDPDEPDADDQGEDHPEDDDEPGGTVTDLGSRAPAFSNS